MTLQLDKKLRVILEKSGKISADDGAALLQEAQQAKCSLTSVVAKKGLCSQDEIMSLLARVANVPPINLQRVKFNPEVLEVISEEVVKTRRIFPIDRIGNMLTLAVVDPFDVLQLDDIRVLTKCQLRLVITTEEAIDQVVPIAYKTAEEAVGDLLGGFDDSDLELKESQDEDEGMDLNAISDESSPVVRMVNKIIADAVAQGASDIHFEPFEKRMIVRYRRDGCLLEAMTLPKRMQNNVTSRIKIMSKLDIAEKQRPQDGKFQMKLGNKAIDFRVSILPVVWGEKTVFRILDSSNLAVDIAALGFEPRSMEDYTWAVERPYGMILVTGPTGSGKSTTLYSAVRHIADPEINLVTVEDPVEYTIEGINQVPVNPKRGLTFAGALRSILRQDPDVILLGEIRDQETLEIAVKAALTGHLVLSTLHTNDAVGTITRMIDMGMDPFNIASATTLICAQRLARKLCGSCKAETTHTKDVYLRLGFTEEDIAKPDFVVHKAVGCGRCGTGYKGRFAVLETMRMSETIKRLVVERRSAAELKQAALAEGMLTLRRCGLLNVMRGVTTIEEVERVTMPD